MTARAAHSALDRNRKSFQVMRSGSGGWILNHRLWVMSAPKGSSRPNPSEEIQLDQHVRRAARGRNRTASTFKGHHLSRTTTSKSPGGCGPHLSTITSCLPLSASK